MVERLQREFPEAILGGTGIDPSKTLEAAGIPAGALDYSIYPEWSHSIGFTSRGCRLRCPFCLVPAKEGRIRETNSIPEIWRGAPSPRELLLLDNDFFGQPSWPARIQEILDGDFRVCFTQGINLRLLTDDQADALASVDYRDDSMKVRRIYTAWDSTKDEAAFFRGMQRLVDRGVNPDHLMVYMLVGFDPKETEDDRLYRQHRLREFGARPYPMPFQRTPELVGFQRWLIGAYDKRFPWEAWKRARYRPENLGMQPEGQMALTFA